MRQEDQNRAHRMIVRLGWRPGVERDIVDHVIVPLWNEGYWRGAEDALQKAAEACHDGAGDTEQELYDHGAAPWLQARAEASARHRENRDEPPTVEPED